MTSNTNGSVQPIPLDNKTLIIKTLNKFEKAIEKGEVGYLKKLINFLYTTSDKASLASLYEDKDNSIRDTHIITLACKYNQPQVLDFFLHKSNILCYLPNHGPTVDNAYIQALCIAIRSKNTPMLETLYNYLSGDLHWLGLDCNNVNSGKVQILTKLRTLLESALKECEEHLERNKQICVDINCLLDFNSFQIELYSQLSRTKHKTHSNERINEVEAIKSDLLIALKLYDQFSSIILSYAPKKCNCIGLCYMCYFSYDVFYRKLDYNTALIIANNIHSLKLRLDLSVDVYQEIECAIYYFLYRVNENWKLYLPKNIPKFGNLSHDEQNPHSAIATLPYYEMGVVIHKEWTKFKQHLRNFKVALENIDVVNKLREKGSKVPYTEVNQLSISPYEALRDDFALKKILQYLEEASKVDFKQDKTNSMLILQRVVQMTGEFLKGENETCHLSPTTLALLQIEMTKATYHYFSDLRNDFSKARGGKLIRRIDLELNENQVYCDVIKDLDVLKNIIHAFISTTYQPVIELHLLKLGLQLLNDRYASIPQETLLYKDDIQKIYDDSEECEQFLEFEKEFVRRNNYLTIAHFREIFFLEKTLKILNKKVSQRNDCIKESLIKNIPKYINTILDGLNMIEKQNNIWNSIRSNYVSICPNVKLSDYPTSESISTIKKTKLKKNPKTPQIIAMKQKLEDENIQDWNKEWCEIRYILTFIIQQANVALLEEKKSQKLASLYQKINNNPNNIGIHHVRLIIKNIKKYCSPLNTSLTHVQQNSYKYESLKILANKIKTSSKGDNKWLKCLVNRMNILNSVLNGERDVDKLILRYIYDISFRNVIDMLVSDIMNIYNDFKLNKLMNFTYTKLHTEFPLRHILNHGSSLIEIFSVSFDDKDYPKALLSFVLKVINDRPYINDLYRLYEDRVKCDDIKLDVPNTLNNVQRNLINNFKKCSEWEEYIKLYV